MTRSYRAFGPILLAVAVAWGCAPSPGGSDRSREAKAQRLEEDFRAAAAARDDLRAKLAAAEDRAAVAERRAAGLQGQFDQARAGLAASAGEREALRADLKSRTAERDALAGQYDGFRKNLKSLLGQAEGVLTSPGELPPPTAVGAGAPPPAVLSN